MRTQSDHRIGSVPAASQRVYEHATVENTTRAHFVNVNKFQIPIPL